jgi:hypothetical protein
LVRPITPAFAALYAGAFGLPSLPANRRDVDDAAVAVRDQVRDDDLAADEHAGQIDVDHLAEVLDRNTPMS